MLAEACVRADRLVSGMRMSRSYRDALDVDGYALLPRVLEERELSRLGEEIASIPPDNSVRQKRGAVFAVREVLRFLPTARQIAAGPRIHALVEPILGSHSRCVRSLLFDKPPSANWKVPWHQDLTIAVRKRIEAEGFGPWSLKAGTPHVQPPASVLEGMLTVRLHLNETDASNGALKALPGSHRHGRLSPEEIRLWQEKHPHTVCSVPQGGGMVMRPLLLHASSSALDPRHRRVLHLEYAAGSLPGGLEWRESYG